MHRVHARVPDFGKKYKQLTRLHSTADAKKVQAGIFWRAAVGNELAALL
jgi:hypothetical protein